MAGAAPTEIQYRDKQEEDFQERVAQGSTQAGHPITAADVNPSKDSYFENITDIAGKVVGHATDPITGTEGLLAHEETTPSYRGRLKLRERVGKLLHRK